MRRLNSDPSPSTLSDRSVHEPTATPSRSLPSSPRAGGPPASRLGDRRAQDSAVGGGADALTRPAPRVLAAAGGAARQASTVDFSREEKRLLNDAAKVVVLEYSSTGGGHTARSLDPLLMAASDQNPQRTLHKNDCVVVFAPPRWESDKDGGKVNTLHQKADELRKAGVNVLIKQSDKSVTGLYQHNGDSDNVRMLQDFVYKPQRDAAKTPLSTERITPERANKPFATGAGAPAKHLLKAVELAIGEGGLHKIAVLGDMAPFLQKAAAHLHGEFKGSVEIGNHQGLFVGDARDQLGDKDLAYLHKASGGGHADKLALVEYSEKVNVVRDLAPTMAQLNIDGHTSKLQARNAVLHHLLDEGVRIETEPGVKARPGILVGDRIHKPDDVKAMVYLYLNEYTQGTVDHIRQQMKDQPETYGHGLFAVCGKDAFKPEMSRDKPSNILQVMYAANADGVTNAGFGTTSEFAYMAHHPRDYAGKFIAFPVVNQHEQQANAAQLAAAMPGKVTNATGPATTMHAAIDGLVAERAAHPRRHLDGDMKRLLDGAQSPVSGPQHAAGLIARLYEADEQDGVLAHEQESPTAEKAKLAMSGYDQGNLAKQSRRIYKLYVPALDAIVNGRPDCTIRATTKVEAQQTQVADVARLLRGIAEPGIQQEAQQLMGIRFDHPDARKLAVRLGETLSKIVVAQDMSRDLLLGGDDAKARALAAAELKDLAENKVALGW
jgi:hypothetical protein